MAGAVLIALTVSALASRSAAQAPSDAEHHIPEHLDAPDFHNTSADRMLVVFSSRECNTCATVVENVSQMGRPGLLIDVVEIENRPALHSKYGIDAVPTILLAEPTGQVIKSFLGPASGELIERAMTEAWPTGNSGDL